MNEELAFEQHVLSCPECKAEHKTGGTFNIPILQVDKPCSEGQRLFDLTPGPKISLEEIKNRRFKLS